MRELRFEYDLAPIRITPQVLAALKEVVRLELPFLKAGNYWVQKSLNKLYQATGYNLPKLIFSLDRVGLLVPLAEFDYQLNYLGKKLIDVVPPEKRTPEMIVNHAENQKKVARAANDMNPVNCIINGLRVNLVPGEPIDLGGVRINIDMNQ
jgi:hypothetical protein